MRNFLAHALDSLTTVAAMTGMIIPPWNLFWWGLGGLAWKVFRVKDPSGDMGLVVVFLPGIIAAAPFGLLSSLIRKK